MFNGMADIEVVSTFSNCNTVVQDINNTKPHVVLMDIDMPGRNGIYGVEKIKEINAEIM